MNIARVWGLLFLAVLLFYLFVSVVAITFTLGYFLGA